MQRQIHTLTGLRGLAALIVFISHSANLSLLPTVFGRGFGLIGPMLFFILSGFLMAHLYVRGEFNISNISRYALARVGRVFPLYLALLFFSVFVSNVLNENFVYSFSDMEPTLLAFGFVKAPYVFWTIPVEVQFYCIFVAFWWLYQRGASPFTLIVFVVLTHAPSIVYYQIGGSIPPVFSTFSIFFFVGVATAIFYDRTHRNKKLHLLARYAGFPLFVLLFINLPQLRLELGLVWSDHWFAKTFADPVTVVIAYGVFFAALFNSRSLAFLNWRPFAFLGKISYGFYLIHMPVLTYVNGLGLGPVAKLLLALSITCLLAYVSLKIFEQPVSRRIRRIRLTGLSAQENR